MKACLDTNVFISVKNQEPDAFSCERILDAIDDNNIQGVISTIVLTEVLVGFYQNNEIQEADRFLNHAILNYEIIPPNVEISKNAAIIRGTMQIKLPDALISATATFAKADFLITNDIPLTKKIKYQILTPQQFMQTYLQVPLKNNEEEGFQP